MSRRLRKKDHIIYKEEADGAFLFDPKSGNLKYMNRMGKEMFLMLDGNRGLQQVIDLFLERYPEIFPDRMAEDIEGFFHRLEDNGFIESTEQKHSCTTATR